MKLQQLIDQTDLEMTPSQVKAFFLGVLSAEKPLPFAKAASELLSAAPESISALEGELKVLWEDLQKNKEAELKKLFDPNAKIMEFLTEARDQLDYFLTAMSLSGTHAESAENEDMMDLIDELEDTVMDMDEYLAEEKPDKAEGEELKKLLLETWSDFLGEKV